MPYNPSNLETISGSFAKYTVNSGETLTTLLGAAYFSGVAAGTKIKLTDGTYDVVPSAIQNMLFEVNGSGTLVQIGGDLILTATATADGTGTGTLVDPGRDFKVLVTSANANNIIVLPTPVIGRVIMLDNQSTTGYELRSSSPTTISIGSTDDLNGVGAGAESAIPARAVATIVARTSTAWVGTTITGVTVAAIETAA